MLYQYSVRGFHHPHHSALGTEIVPVQCLTLIVERRVFGALRMATPRGGRGVTIGPDTCHSDFIFVSSNFWNTHFLPLLHWKSPGTKLGLHFSVYSKMDPFLSLPDLKVRCPYSQSCSLGLPPKMMVGSKSVSMTWGNCGVPIASHVF